MFRGESYKDIVIRFYFLRIIVTRKNRYMKKLILVITLVLYFAGSEGFGQEAIVFNDKPWSELLATAKNQNKLIFLDAYASWCGPCKWMAANIFTNDTVADYFNKTFICARIDMEKGEGPGLARQYQVRAYPTLLFIDRNGNMIHKKVGADRIAQHYIAMGETALNPDQCFSASVKKYESGNYSPDFIPFYAGQLADAYMPVEPVLQKYFSSLTPEQKLDRDSWYLISRYVGDMNSPLFEFLVKNRAQYAKLYTKDSVYDKISDVYIQALVKAARGSRAGDSAYNALKDKIRATGFEEAEAPIFYSDLMLFQFRGEKEKYLALAYDKVDKYYRDDYNMLNNIAWSFQEMTNDKKYLDKAASWAKRSIALNDLAMNNDTYAFIQLKMGNREEAIKYEKNAIRLAKEKNESTRDYEESLKRMMEPPK